MSDIINVSALTKEFAGDIQVVMALRHVNLEIAKGEFIAIMGSSGSGKSTLLNILSGLDRPTSGEILLDGLSLHNCTEQELTQVRRDKIGFIFQSFHLISVLTALENVSLPLLLTGQNGEKVKGRAKYLLERVGLTDRVNHYPSQLSGGQQQRVAIARALMNDPKIIMADEPTGSLDSNMSISIMDLLRECVKEMQQTLVMVTHDPMVATYADRIFFMKDGHFHDELILKTEQNLTLQEKMSRVFRKMERL